MERDVKQGQLSLLCFSTNDTLLRQVQNILDKHFFNLYCSTNMEDAISIVDKYSPDVVMMELHSANLDVFPFIDKIRNLKAELKIIGLIADFNILIIQQALDKKVEYLLNLPLDSRKLLERIHSIADELLIKKKVKKLEEDYEQAQDRLHRALDAAMIGWWEWNVETGEVFFSDNKATMIGYKVEEFPTNVYKIMELVHPDDYEPTMQAMRDHLSGKKPTYDVRYRIKAKCNDWIWYYDKGKVVESYENGEPKKVIGTTQEITNIVNKEMEIEEQRRKLEESLLTLKKTQAQLIYSEKMSSLGMLTAGIAHELQNPLNFVKNFSEIAQEMTEELNEKMNCVQQYLPKPSLEEMDHILKDCMANIERIISYSNKADNVIKRMLFLSGGQVGSFSPTDINQVIREYLDLAYNAIKQENPDFNAYIDLLLDSDLDHIFAVSQDISRVFINIFNNAFYVLNEKWKQYSIQKPDQIYKPCIQVSTKDEGDYIIIRIKDNGLGIPKDLLGKIFNPFFTTKPSGVGIGLGLTLSYDTIVQHHKGRIQVDSKEDEYTEFIIELPKRDMI